MLTLRDSLRLYVYHEQPCKASRFLTTAVLERHLGHFYVIQECILPAALSNKLHTSWNTRAELSKQLINYSCVRLSVYVVTLYRDTASTLSFLGRCNCVRCCLKYQRVVA